MADDDRVLLGRIGAAHGIKGEVRLKSYTDPTEAIVGYGPLETRDGGRRFDIDTWRPSKDLLIVHFAGIGDRDAAETLNGTDLYVGRERLPEPDEDEFYHADLIGLNAVGQDGVVMGTVIAIQDFGAGDLLEIKPPVGPSVYLPFTRDAVPEIDLAGRRVVIVPPPGLFEEAEPDETDGAAQ